MNGFKLFAIAAATCAGILPLAGVSARAGDEIVKKIDNLTKADKAAIVRGYSIPTGTCAVSLVENIQLYGGKTNWRIRFGGSEPIQFWEPGTSLRHECINGEHWSIEGGKRTLSQKWDEDGEPTMDDEM